MQSKKAGAGSVPVWSLHTGETKQVLDTHAVGRLAIAFSPDGRTLASADITLPRELYSISLWDVDSGEPVWRGIHADGRGRRALVEGP